MANAAQKVILRPYGLDFHGEGCECGLCGLTGQSYGMGVYDAEEARFYDGKHYLCSALDVAYAPTEGSAMHNARLAAEKNGMCVLDDQAFEKFCANRPQTPAQQDEDFDLTPF